MQLAVEKADAEDGQEGNRTVHEGTAPAWEHIERPQPLPRPQNRSRHDAGAAVRRRRHWGNHLLRAPVKAHFGGKKAIEAAAKKGGKKGGKK